MTDLYQKQIELENEYNTQSVIDSQKQVLDAYANGRAADLGNGRILVARAFESAIEPYKELLSRKATGTRGKYLGLLRPIDPEIVVMLGLRVVIDGCAKAEPVSLQNTLTLLGKCIETEALLMATGTVSQAYTDRTVEYLDTKGTKSISHRYRTLMAGAEALGFTWTSWSVQERVSTARIVLDCLYEETGLFQWYTTGSSSMYYIKPTDVLAKYLTDAIDAAKGITRLPPMLTPPMDWEGQYSGGYLTEWARSRTPMCSLRMHTQAQRKWVIDGLGSERAAPLRQAMNKAQRTPYRVNHEVLEVLRQALGYGTGILGLPSTVAAPRPVFPFPEGWLKDDATETELDQFSFWKTQVAEWHTLEAKRVGRKVSLLSKCRELIRFKDEAAMYFPTFIDWRGRVYFRSTIHPQLNDAVKGCLEFAEGKRLGSVGLYWLKVHVANCCGYDKHDPDIKVKWCEDNWAMIKHFIDNPFDIDAPEPDTAFTLLQAAYALRAAYELDNPEDYICHVPVAMDATCSGLNASSL